MKINITPRTMHVFWFTVIAIGVVGEAYAIARHGAGFTMSEWVWSKIHSAPMRMLVSALLVWLFYHFVWSGPGRGLGWRDLAFVGVGLALGYAAYSHAIRSPIN